MILTRDDIKELKRVGSLEVVMAKAPATGNVQAVQITVGTPAVAKAKVVDSWPHRNGGTVVVVELVATVKSRKPRPKKVRDEVRLMKPGKGETKDARHAMRVVHVAADPETTGVPHPNLTDSEPEMVDRETENRFVRRSHQANELRVMENQRRSLVERIDRTLEGCERLGVDPTRHIAALDRRLSDLEKRVKKAERRKAA